MDVNRTEEEEVCRERKDNNTMRKVVDQWTYTQNIFIIFFLYFFGDGKSEWLLCAVYTLFFLSSVYGITRMNLTHGSKKPIELFSFTQLSFIRPIVTG